MEPALPDRKETIQILWVLFAATVIAAAIILISRIDTASAGPQPSVFDRCMTALGYNPPDQKNQPEASREFHRNPNNKAAVHVCTFGQLKYNIPYLMEAVRNSPDRELPKQFLDSGMLPVNPDISATYTKKR